jgi:hypothetical protein
MFGPNATWSGPRLGTDREPWVSSRFVSRIHRTNLSSSSSSTLESCVGEAGAEYVRASRRDRHRIVRAGLTPLGFTHGVPLIHLTHPSCE